MHADYYALFGVARTATAEEIRAAYRRLAQRLHPDAGGDAGAEDRFKEITHAYQTLRNPSQRAIYDISLVERELDILDLESRSAGQWGPDVFTQDVVRGPVHRPAPAPGASWERDFGDGSTAAAEPSKGLFARLRRARGAPAAVEGVPLPGEDYELIAEISLEKVIHGGTVALSFTAPGPNGAWGRKREVEIRIPKLVPRGYRLTLKGASGEGVHGGPNGDLHVEVAYRPHPLFRLLTDTDIWFYLPITPWEAVLGAIVEMPTLEKPFRVHIPAGSTSGQTFRLKGRGLPDPERGRGDLLACLRMTTPPVPTEVEKNLYRQLLHASRFNPRVPLTDPTSGQL